MCVCVCVCVCVYKWARTKLNRQCMDFSSSI